MRRADHRSLLILLACSAGAACSDAGDADGNGEGADELELWPIPSVGITGSTSSSRDAGMDAGRPRDGGGVVLDAKAEMDSAPPPPPDLSLQVFDPNQVYLFGTLGSGSCTYGIASVFDPNRVAVGFDCSADGDGAQIRPSDGRLLYRTNANGAPVGVNVFSCDGCIPDAGTQSYPARPAANDEVIATLCGADAGPQTEFGFRVLPDSGVLQLCTSRWVDVQGQAVAASKPNILAFGHANSALLNEGLLDLGDAQVQPLVSPPIGTFRAYRVREDGYWVALVPAARGGTELWQIALDGGASQVGTYPPPPANQTIRLPAKLDGQGALFETANTTSGSLRNTIVRRTLDGGSDVVYDEGLNPRLKMNRASLVTGP